MIKEKTHSPVKSGVKPTVTFINAKGKKEDINSLNVLNYQNYETLKVHNKNKKFYVQTDTKFLRDIRKIVKVRQNTIFNILNINKSQLTNQQCDQLDYRARLHARANIVNQNTKKNPAEVDQEDRCQCGCNRCRGDFIPLCSNQQNLNVLGPGVLLLFLFKKAIAAILVSIVVIYALFAFITNLLGREASSLKACDENMYCEFKSMASNENKLAGFNLYYIQEWLGLAFCVVWIFMLRSVKYVGQQKNRIIDDKLRSASDYAILIENLPRGSYEEREIIGYFEGFWDKIMNDLKKEQNTNIDEKKLMNTNESINRFKMKSIQIIYNMEFSREMIESIFQHCFMLDSLLEADEGSTEKNLVKQPQQYRRIKNKLKQTYELLLDLRKKFLNDPEFRKGLSTTCCIIEFKSQNMMKLLLKHFGIEKVGVIKRLQALIKKLFDSSSRNILFKGKVLRIERAPEPSDIMWKNCEKKFSLARLMVIYGVTFFIILFSFGLMTGLKYLQAYAQRTYDQTGIVSTVINLAISVGMNIINKFLWFSLFYLLDLEFNHTLTEKIISQMNKVLMLSCVNIIVLPIISNYVVLHQGFVFGNQGLAGFAFDYHISCILQIITKLADPVMIIKKVLITIRQLRYKLIRFLVPQPAKVDFRKGSTEVNTFYQGEYFDVAQNYIYLITAILHAVFFCQLQPFIILLVTAMAGLFYIVNRIKLTRICKIPQMTQYLVFDTAIYMLGYVPIFFGVGTIVLSYLQHRQNTKYPFQFVGSAIAIGIGVLGLINPGDIFNKIVKFLIIHFRCINIGQLMGEYDEENAQDEEQQDQYTQEDSESSLDVKSRDLRKETKKPVNSNSRLQSYYGDSNALSLLGFEKVLRGENQKIITSELKLFSESFFPKAEAIEQKDVLKLIANQMNNVKFTDTVANTFLSPQKNQIAASPQALGALFGFQGSIISQDQKIMEPMGK